MMDLIEILRECDFNAAESKTLAFLIEHTESDAYTIEKKMDMRQPQVSMSLKKLFDKGWLDVVKEHKSTRGRPVKIYSISDRNKIIVSLKEIINKKTNKYHEILNVLEEMYAI